jgi:hypothetical protein
MASKLFVECSRKYAIKVVSFDKIWRTRKMTSDPHLQVYAFNFYCEAKQQNLIIAYFP